MLSQLYPATLACVLVFHKFASQTYTQAGYSTVHVFSCSLPSTGCPVTVFQHRQWLQIEFIPKPLLWSVNTVVVYIKCFTKRKLKEKVALSSQNDPFEVQKFINWLSLFFRECFNGHYFKYSSCYHSALIRWSHQSFSWSTWSAPNVGWCVPLSCQA